MSEEAPTPASLSRVVDFKIPLPYLLSIAGFLGAGLVSMWFNVNQLVRTTEELQITVKSGNMAQSVMSGQVELLKFRVSINEDDIKYLKSKDRSSLK